MIPDFKKKMGRGKVPEALGKCWFRGCSLAVTFIGDGGQDHPKAGYWSHHLLTVRCGASCLSVPRFVHLQNGYSDGSYRIGLLSD